MNVEISPEIKRFLPLYVVLGRSPEQNSWQGRIENSFSMDWSFDRVRLWWSGKAFSILGEHKINGKNDAEYNCPPRGGNTQPGWEYKVFDLTSDECPIEVDLVQWLVDMDKGARPKFENRNPKFTIKP